MATTAKMKEAAREAGKEAQSSMAEMAEQALRNWEKAVRSGIKLQEQAGQWWSESLNTFSAAQDWQRRMMHFGSLASGLIPQAQKQMEQAMDYVHQNTRAAADVYQKAVDAAQSPILPEKDSRWMDVWTSSMKAVRSNTEAVMEMNNQALGAWMQFMRRADQEVHAKAS